MNDNKKVCLSIPMFLWKQIQQVSEIIPQNTDTGVMLTLLEKGINYYWKALKKQKEEAPVANETSPQESAKSPVDQKDDSMKETIKIAQTPWAK